MKIHHRAFKKDGEGSVKVTPEDDEDMWHLFNLVREGDELRSLTSRKVQVGNREDQTERIKLTITIAVVSVDYDGESELRCKGRCASENPNLEMGAFHTITLKPHAALTLSKGAWDSLDVARLQEAGDPAATADLAVVLVAEGLAHVCLIGRSTTLLRAKVEVSMPKKRGAGSVKGHADAEERFLKRTYTAITTHVDFDTVRCLLLAGPGFTRDKLRSFLISHAHQNGDKALLRNKDAIICAAASSAYLQAIPELLTGSGVAQRVADTKAAREVAALEEFFMMLASDSTRAFYGPGHVIAAAEQAAIATLLISDSLYRVNDVRERRRWVALVEKVEAAGGRVHIFSARHTSGQQLFDFSGVAVVLRFGLPELEERDPAELLAALSL